MRIARVLARHAVALALVLVALAPTSVLAFTPPAPGNPGHHYGELIHNPHMQPSPGGGGGNNGGGANNGSSGISNSLWIGGSASDQGPSIDTPGVELSPTTGGGFDTVAAVVVDSGQNSALVVIILAALIAANVSFAVVYVARGGNFLMRRVLSPVPAAA